MNANGCLTRFEFECAGGGRLIIKAINNGLCVEIKGRFFVEEGRAARLFGHIRDMLGPDDLRQDADHLTDAVISRLRQCRDDRELQDVCERDSEFNRLL